MCTTIDKMLYKIDMKNPLIEKLWERGFLNFKQFVMNQVAATGGGVNTLDFSSASSISKPP